MNATHMQNSAKDRVLDNKGLASVTLTLHWSDGRAEHEDEMHVEKFSVWREADFLPAAIGTRIPGMRTGDSAQAELSAGEVTGDWDAGQQICGSLSGFDRNYRRGLAVEPRLGGFYPRGIFHGFRDIVREAVEPARITALDEANDVRGPESPARPLSAKGGVSAGRGAARIRHAGRALQQSA